MATILDQQRHRPQQQHQHEPLTPQQMMQVASMERAEPETDPYILRMAYQVCAIQPEHNKNYVAR
jgi:hypothetical protein